MSTAIAAIAPIAPVAINYANIQNVARTVARRLPPTALIDSDDLAQSSALAALRGRRSIVGPMLDLMRDQGWIASCRSTNKNHCVVSDGFRILIFTSDPRPSAYHHIVQEETMKAVSAAVSSLPLRQYQIIKLIYWDDMPKAAVARRFNLHPSRISQLHKKALCTIKEFLQ